MLQRGAVCCSAATAHTTHLMPTAHMLLCVVACCSVLQYAYTLKMQRCFTSSRFQSPTNTKSSRHYNTLQHTATHCNTLQHTATHCNTLQHIPHPTLQKANASSRCNTLQHSATHHASHPTKNTRPKSLQHTATHCNTLQHTATHCNTLQHTTHPTLQQTQDPSH